MLLNQLQQMHTSPQDHRPGDLKPELVFN